MPTPRIIPALADLTQAIAGPVPIELLHDWAAGREDLTSARTLLAPFELTGAVVASDTSGLSRLTREMDLLDVLHSISRPKQIVHAIGVAIGGRAVGRWVADNTTMHYPASVGLAGVVDAMAEAQSRIAALASVKIGMCIHPGRFYELGGALYGPDARAVELLAEHHAGPGEILLTGEAVAELHDRDGYRVHPRAELAPHHPRGVFALEPTRRMPDLIATDTRYPHGYTEEFFELLLRFPELSDLSRTRDRLYATYQRDRTVLVVVREQFQDTTDDLTAMLDDLLRNALLDAIVRDTVRSPEAIVRSAGGLAILTFPTPPDALDTAQWSRERCVRNGLEVRIAIDHGPVLSFENPDGSKDIAGDAINTACKIAEDAGRPGQIYVTTRAASALPAADTAQPFRATVSGVLLTGIVL